MRKSIAWAVICLLAEIGLTACGGSGGGGGNSTPELRLLGTVVNLSQIKNFAEATTPGSTISFTVAGSIDTHETDRVILFSDLFAIHHINAHRHTNC